MTNPTAPKKYDLKLGAPLPGWIRIQHKRTKKTMDLNPANADHQILIPYFKAHQDWEVVSE